MNRIPLPEAFYSGSPVEEIARALIGCRLCVRRGARVTSGIIVETEAYGGGSDRASHAHNGRRTARTEPMFGPPGRAYVYLCYGMHALFNVVTGPEGEASAVLIRALEPDEGIAAMRRRRGPGVAPHRLASGPGVLCRALGIRLNDNRANLVSGGRLWIEPRPQPLPETAIGTGTRVGVAYAGADAYRPWRFALLGHPCTSPALGTGGDHPDRNPFHTNVT
jgi:DNA-3-methyladenine glycosylase